MSKEESAETAEENPFPVAPIEAFDLPAINATTRDLDVVEVWSFSDVFGRAYEAAQAAGDITARGYRILAAMCSIVLRPDDKAGALAARWTLGMARSASPEDFAGEQCAVLAELAPLFDHPGLRARVADICWTTDRRGHGRLANLAIAAYCECADQLDTGRVKARFESAGSASFEALRYIERAAFIAYGTQKGRILPPVVIDGLASVYQGAMRQAAYAAFAAAARLTLYYELRAPAEVAADIEHIAGASPDMTYVMVLQDLWNLAAELYDRAEMPEARRRCQLAAIEMMLVQRDQVSSAGAKAHWVQVALFALRHVIDTEDRRRELRRELRDLQEDSLSEFGWFRIPLGMEETAAEQKAAFDGMDLADALRELAVISQSRDIGELRAEALNSLEDFPLQNMMAAVYSGQDGLPAAHSPGAAIGEAPDEDWFKATINRNEGIRRQQVLAGLFEPARQSIVSRYDIGERHLLVIVAASPFVRQEQVLLMALGFARMLQGDHRSAVHLLVPQLEPCLRYLLRLAGHDPTIDHDDMTAESVGLGAMLDRFRGDLERILPPEVVLELELLFHHKPGAALRHAVAHGLIGVAGCFSPDAIYACWLMYQLTCWPLLAQWEQQIAPTLRAHEA